MFVNEPLFTRVSSGMLIAVFPLTEFGPSHVEVSLRQFSQSAISKVSRLLTLVSLASAGLLTVSSPAHAQTNKCMPALCNVHDFSGVDIDEKIARAMQAAKATPHGVVFFPAGIYPLKKTIKIIDPETRLTFRGVSDRETILSPVPRTEISSTFDVSRTGGYTDFNLRIENLAISYSDPRLFGAGHGIRVRRGWMKGSLSVENVSIVNAPYYGIGIQNSDDNDLPASNVVIRNVTISGAGSDGIDTKRPIAGNSNLTIENVRILQIGHLDEQSAAALDISYDRFLIKDVTIVTEPYRITPASMALAIRNGNCQPDGTRCKTPPVSGNVGIRLRERQPGGSASFGKIQNLMIKGTSHGIFFAGTKILNQNISIENFSISDFEASGLYLRGSGLEISNGCVFAPRAAAVGREIVDSAQSPRIDRSVGKTKKACPPEKVGQSNPRKKK